MPELEYFVQNDSSKTCVEGLMQYSVSHALFPSVFIICKQITKNNKFLAHLKYTIIHLQEDPKTEIYKNSSLEHVTKI
jgi:hypothetical protein